MKLLDEIIWFDRFQRREALELHRAMQHTVQTTELQCNLIGHRFKIGRMRTGHIERIHGGFGPQLFHCIVGTV